MPRIVLDGVLKSFAGVDGKTVTAVDHLSLAVQEREWLALVGPSGCGKTTTLRVIAGLESPEAGRILFDNQPVTALPPVERDVAMVFQSHALFPHFIAFDNLAFGLKLRRVAQAEIRDRVHEVAGWLGLTHCLDRKPGQLSGGERQRVALGRALVRRPKILLLDEPFSHLDEPLRVQLRAELMALRARLEMTIVYVTHDQAEALMLGDRVAVLRKGRLQQLGTPREVYEKPANPFVAGFVGSPPMNLFPGTAAPREGHLVFVAAEAVAETPPSFILPLGGWRADWFSQNLGRPILLGVRPECMNLSEGEAQADAGPQVLAAVQSLEYLGAEMVIRLVAGGHRVVGRVASSSSLRTGQKVALSFDLSEARVYDAATGTLLF